jgi:hypothetical protein
MTQMMCWQENDDRIRGAWHIGTDTGKREELVYRGDLGHVTKRVELIVMRERYDPEKLTDVPTAWLRPYPISENETP